MPVQVLTRTEDEIDKLVASGQYANAGEVIGAAVRLLAERERKLRWLRDELAIGEEQERRGELIELTPERFEEITRRGFDDARNGKPIKDAVQPRGRSGIHPAL